MNSSELKNMVDDPSVQDRVDDSLMRMQRDKAFTSPTHNIVLLMRGLPSSGKSFLARELAVDGVLCETDRYLREPSLLERDECSMEEARQANLNRFKQALVEGQTPIVVDRGNGLNEETYAYVVAALEYGYDVRLVEPDSPWWREIRTLLRYRPETLPILEAWATALARINESTNGVSRETILDWLDGWIADLSTAELVQEAKKFAGVCS